MGKKIFFLFILFLFLPLFSVNALEQSQRWVCLKAEKLGGHKATISVDPASKPLANSKTYVFECLSNSACTSGNSTVDQEVFGKNNLQEMQNAYGYGFKGSTLNSNPTMSDSFGQIPPFDWQSFSVAHERRFLALNYFNPIPQTGTGEAATQQIGTFSFEEVINKSNCVSVRWDPYGRIFDSSTLDPVSGASVTLLKKRENDLFTKLEPGELLGGNLENPQTTEEDGGFSFIVPDGTYKLSVAQGKYTFPVQLTNIQSNYSRIYSDIYPGQIGEEIIQAGIIQHRDIPLKPKSTSLSNEAKLMEHFLDLDKASLMIYVRGRISHPFARIKAYSLKPDPILKENARYRLLTEEPIVADKFGNFTLKIDQSGFEPDESFGDITVEKVDLTKAANLVEKIKRWFFSLIDNVNAQVTLASTFRFDPIPNYLEGYAYDSKGEVIPNATVAVILNFSNKPSHQVKADENGYFKIGSEFLPSMPYRVSYAAPSGQVTSTSTSKFIVQNQGLIEDSHININQFKNEKGEVISPVPKITNQNQLEKKSTTPITNNILPFVLAIFITLIIILIVVFIYFKKKYL
ncbi:MAG: carboxypeptidase-like regulatory domain-containing protein [Candidatus Roizmanbacteria bacterium]